MTLGALGLYLSKSRVYDVVQAVAERVPGLKREAVFGGIRTPAMGGFEQSPYNGYLRV